jgi:hypothetical protein
MGRHVNKWLVCAMLLVALMSVARAQRVVTRRCGYDRWPVKTVTDLDRGRVNFTPINVSVAALSGVPVHEIPYPQDKRIAPEEFSVYRVRAMLVEIRSERDSDLHLILSDLERPSVRMIAEIPAPECAEGSGYESMYERARLALAEISTGSVVEITGIGFFDFVHGATGGAQNGIELHPVLTLKLVGATSSSTQHRRLPSRQR